MLFEIFKFEVQYRMKKLETYMYFLIVFITSLFAVDFVYQGIDLGQVKLNAPSVVAFSMSVISCLLMMISSIIMGTTILRDFNYKMESLVFINPIKKSDYLLGRFFGAGLVLIFIFSGILFGMISNEFMPWRSEESLLNFNPFVYFQPFLALVIPTLLYGGVIFFISAALSRKLIVVYTQAMFFFILYLFSNSIDNRFVSAIVDPFSLNSINFVKGFWTSSEINSLLIPMDGVILYNRLLWLTIGIVVFFIGYYSFSFNVVRKTIIVKKNEEKSENSISFHKLLIPKISLRFNLKSSFFQIMNHANFTFRIIVKETSFWTIVICGMIIIFINSTNIGVSHGVNSLPTSYLIVSELIENSIFFFFIIFIYFSADIIWKERDIKFNLIYDSMPFSNLVNLTGKFIGLIYIYILLIFTLILSGIFLQTMDGYYNYEMDVYIKAFFVELFPYFILYSFIAFFIHVIVNHKYLGQILSAIFIVLTIAFQLLGIDHGLLVFGGSNINSYSDMNGYGHFLEPYLWFKSYWFVLTVLLFIIASFFTVRDVNVKLKYRLKLAIACISSFHKKLIISLSMLFLLIATYIFYNTNILNSYTSRSFTEEFRADYEKQLKHFEYFPQLKIIDVNINLELYPRKKAYDLEAYYILKNLTQKPVQEIHIQSFINDNIELKDLRFNREVKLDATYNKFRYNIYRLKQALNPNDSVKLSFKQTLGKFGFIEHPNTNILDNGTYFDNYLFMPTLGYNRKYEIRDNHIRKSYKLNNRNVRASRENKLEQRNAISGDDGYQINLDITIGTDSNQTAISSGNLIKKWKVNNRNYFHYKTDEAIINFYPIASAKYEVARGQWTSETTQPVNLEIYHHKGHEYNLERMMKSMKYSLDYFTKEFSEYQYNHMRIVEVPRYLGGAVSLPNTILYTENLGFIMDVNEQTDVDMPFFITAHEMAHQWWGLQVAAANVQGRSMILESLAQYSALMVLKKHYPIEKIQQFLLDQQKYYLSQRNRDKEGEKPLALVEKHKHIHYGKGAVNLFTLQDYISEEKVNLALKRFIRDWRFGGEKSKERYATTSDLLVYFKDVAPDSLQYLIDDLFNKIVLFDNKIISAEYEKVSKKNYLIKLDIETIKFSSDSLGNETQIKINDWIDIGVYSENRNGIDSLVYLEKHHIIEDKKIFHIKVNSKPKKAGIDPIHKMIDRKPKNNVKNVTLR